MKSWRGAHVLSTKTWSVERVNELLDLAREYKLSLRSRRDRGVNRHLICLTLFYEPSTRTRLSFECAAHRLGLSVLSAANAANDTSAYKGETLEDTGRIASQYADLLVVRHPEKGAAAKVAMSSSVPVINAGDGEGEHPTQALLDLFTIREAFGSLRGLRVGLCGDLLYGRTVHSLMRLLVAFGCDVTQIAPPELALPPEVLQELADYGSSIRHETNLQEALPHLDVLYMTRVQKERFADIRDYQRVRHAFRLEREQLKDAPSSMRILHPLPRIDELAPDVDDDSRALYFTQAANGVPVRMALLSAVVGLETPVPALVL